MTRAQRILEMVNKMDTPPELELQGTQGYSYQQNKGYMGNGRYYGTGKRPSGLQSNSGKPM